ncbi:peptidoglycan-binding domain-containing protein [Streptomyces sp. NPDC051582]|uniref:peptidoglycan-binding domain-containing protein n=1 Tax=Streptomyces sp. NPDC051582 TaxID=3155167 RepID=UPI00344AA727
MTLPEPRPSDDPPPPQPVRGVVAGPAGGYAAAAQTPAGDDTPAYGTPVAWPDSPPQTGWPAGPARPRPAGPVEGGATGGGGAPARRPRSPRRRRLPTVLAGAGTLVAVGTAALALGMIPRSGDSDTVLLDAKPSAPAASAAPTGPTQSAATRGPSRSASPSASASPSPSASKSASPSASPSASRSSAPPSPTPSTSASRTQSSPPPPPKAPTLRYGDSGPEVEKMQRLLAGRGYYRGKINGKFDSRTENAVSDFQWQNGIDEDWGVYGPQTRQALGG